MRRVRLAAEPIDPAAELQRFMEEAQGVGAVVTFTGVVRGEDGAGGAVEALFLDHYPGMTEASMEWIAAGAPAAVQAVRIVHRCGEVSKGDTVVFVAAAARHRREAFLAVDEMMDRLKTEAMFWKREVGVDGARWIEPSDRDRADAARWSGSCPE